MKPNVRQKMNQNAETMQNDVIDLRELFLILKKRKNLISIITMVITLFAVIYTFFIAKPIYEVSATIEIAQIDHKPVQDLVNLKQKVEVLFDVNSKTKTVEFPLVSDIKIPKDSTTITIIKTQGYDNNSTKKKLQEVISYITLEQNKELTSYKDIQQGQLALIDKDITRNQNFIVKIKKNMNHYQNKLLNISTQDAALAGIYSIEIGKKQTELNDAASKIYSLENKKNNLERSISPIKIQETTVVGNIELRDYPIKPKKSLITIVAFITGLMIAIFLAFFFEFLQGMKKEES
ncbi:MAG: hypothetical protein COA92_02620 [Sulfurovum sp.]|nr:MAG: hypothetical protein COA92_02620 [Sulfurovum sp.]